MKNPAAFSVFGKASQLAAVFFLAAPLPADQLLYDTAAQWRQWHLPLGVVEFTPTGRIQPVAVHKNINAVDHAVLLGGGIHRVGSNLTDAPLVIDGDLHTGWRPDPTVGLENWDIEIDLGRGVSAHRVQLFFDQTAPPFELFDLMLSTGEHELDQVGNPIGTSLIYRIWERYKGNQRHQVTFELNHPLHTPIQFVRIANLKHIPGAALTEVRVEAFGDNLVTGLLDKGGNIDIVTAIEMGSDAVTLGNAFALIDGDLTTQFVQRNEPRAPFDVHGHITVDLGAVYWVDQVRLISGVVVRSGGGGGIVSTQYVSRRSFIYKYYEVLTSDGSLSPNGTRVWTTHYADWPTPEAFQRGMADHLFAPLPTRFVRFRWRVWDASCAFGVGGQAYTARNCLVTGRTEELQVFGAGFPRQAVLRSPLIDLGTNKNLNAIRWQAETPPGTRVEIRTRTGNEVIEQLIYRDNNGKEVTKRRWEKLIPSFRGPIDTLITPGGDWSSWSKLYGVSGAAFQSPSPRRFVEVDVRLIGDTPADAPGIDWLALDFTPPLADRVVGEIAPTQVQPGALTQFSYFLRPTGRATHFDRVEVEASTPLRFIAALVDTDPIAVALQPTDSGFEVTFPRAIGDRQLVELRFESAIFSQATRVDVFLEDSGTAQVRQPVDPGDANPQVTSNTNIVAIPVNGRLFGAIDITPRVLTPNGDGRNDALVVAVDLVNVLVQRPLSLRVFDLSGRLLYGEERQVVAGRQTLSWDGRIDGRTIPPGMYLVEVHIEGDARQQSERRLMAVAY